MVEKPHQPSNSEQLVNANGVCSPKAHGNYKKYGICIPQKYMRDIAQRYNKQHPDNSISPISFKSISDLKNELDIRLGCKGKSEKCWLRSKLVHNTDALYEKLNKMYRPDMPSSWKLNPKEWLSNLDIENVMLQYEDLYPNFKFLGVFSVDFYTDNVCHHYSFCNFNLFDFLATGKKQFGMVINLDKYSGSGTHWVSLFASFDIKDPKFGFCYYDSGAKPPPMLAKHFLKQLKEEANLFFKDHFNKEISFDKRFKKQCNSKEHQKENTECGMFSMLFLIMCLENKQLSYNEICNTLHEGSDDVVNSYRQKLYHAKY